MQASRIDLANRYDLSQRDLSLLYPWVPLPLPASFMVRKRAILANLGAVRMLISRCEVCIGHAPLLLLYCVNAFPAEARQVTSVVADEVPCCSALSYLAAAL